MQGCVGRKGGEDFEDTSKHARENATKYYPPITSTPPPSAHPPLPLPPPPAPPSNEIPKPQGVGQWLHLFRRWLV